MNKPASESSLKIVSLALATALCTPLFASAEISSPVPPTLEDAKRSEVTIQPLRDNVSILFGSGGNIGVLSTPEGKLMVDAGIAVSSAKIQAALDKLGGGPVNYVVNTHYHWDHTDGNAWVHRTGATIVAHRNVLARLSTTTRVIDWGFTFPPAPEDARPTEVVEDQRTIAFHGETVKISHFGSGHTDGDLVVYFTRADVLMMGDIWWNGLYPFIDYGAGGGINGMITWADKCLAMTTSHTIFVPGHGPIGSRADLVEFRDMLRASRDRVAALKKQGMTLAQIVAAKPTLPYDAKYGKFWIDPEFFTTLVYNGV